LGGFRPLRGKEVTAISTLHPLRRASAEFGRSGLAAAHWALSQVLHREGRACIYGWPDHEENSLFAAALLARRTDLKVTLLAADPAAARRYLSLVDPSTASVEVLRKNSLAGLIRASEAEILLFTHGLYGSPRLTDRKLVINLWHGYGPKANDNAAFAARIPFSVLTCNTPVWGAAAARWLGEPEASVRRTGNPRQVAFANPACACALAKLGLEPGRFILWMPTYRAANGASGPAWRDCEDLAQHSGADGQDAVSEVASLARAAGVEVIVKPHPLDPAHYERSGLRVITTDQIFASGTTLYQLVAASQAMISDYSSVWVEYLDLDKPLILFCPDLADYDVGRGFSRPTMMELAPDLIVRSAGDLSSFFEAVSHGADWRPAERRAARSRLQTPAGPVDGAAFTAVVLEELARRRAGRAKPPRRAY